MSKLSAILYTSASGFTRQYAQMLSEATGLPAFDICELSSGVKKGAPVLYMGWLKAGSIVNFPKVSKEFDVQAICAIGMSTPTQDQVTPLKERFHISVPVFYLEGGFDITKLRGMNRLLMKMFTKFMASSIEKKAEKTAEDLATLDFCKNGGNHVKRENLDPVLTWLQSTEAYDSAKIPS